MDGKRVRTLRLRLSAGNATGAPPRLEIRHPRRATGNWLTGPKSATLVRTATMRTHPNREVPPSLNADVERQPQL